MRLVSVNVGTPHEVRWSGRTVRTAFFKKPVDGPRYVRRLNVDGDQQADLIGHGGEHRAVFVYQLESYRHWERFLGREPMPPGTFGENFTVEGMPDDQVCIGDRYRIGGALFEVTQPRVTCFKVGMVLGEPRMPALVYEHGRPGFYLRVLEEGPVRAGDSVQFVARGPEQMTVREISALLYLPGHSRDGLRRALRVPALPDGWRSSFEALLEQGDRPGNPGLTSAAATAVAWRGMREFRVSAIGDETPSVRALELEPLDGRPLPGYEAGQYVTVSLTEPGLDRPLLRTYSLSSAGDARRWRISVKREPSGRAGKVIHEALAVGDVLPLGAPRGTFTVPDDERPIVFLGAGIGITPLLAMLDQLARARDTREIWWIYSAGSPAEVPHAGEAKKLLSRQRARVVMRYTRAAQRLEPAELPRLGVPLDAHFMLCGPDGFMEDMTAGLISYGVPPGLVHRESFATARSGDDGKGIHAPGGPEGPGPTISFARSGLTVRWDPGRYGSLLELAEACDVPVTWSCRTGACHLCESGVIAGRVTYVPRPLDAPAEGNALLCCSIPSGELVLDV